MISTAIQLVHSSIHSKIRGHTLLLVYFDQLLLRPKNPADQVRSVIPRL